MNTYMMSLGQLVNSDTSKSINAFSALLPTGSFYSYFGTWWIKLSLLIDKIWYKTIDNYKLGNIKTEDFRKQISKQLGIKPTDEQFDAAWNAMSVISEETSTDIVDLIRTQKNCFNISIISATNELHIDYITSEIDKVLVTNGLPKLHENDKFRITTSCAEKTLSLKKLTQKTMSNIEFDDGANYFGDYISFHTSITHINTRCIPLRSLKDINQTINDKEKLNNLHQSDVTKEKTHELGEPITEQNEVTPLNLESKTVVRRPQVNAKPSCVIV